MTHSSVVLWAVIVQILSESIQIGGQYIGARQRIHNHPIRAPHSQKIELSPDPDLEIDGRHLHLQEIHPLTDIYKFRRTGYNSQKGYEPKKLHPCEQSSCYPATGNLLIGRENQLYASSTCGLYGQQRYCIVSHLDAERKKCFWCDSRPTSKPNPLLNHNISNIVYRMYPGTRTKSWWQSENGKEKVYRYFAYNCSESFPGVREGPPRDLTDVVCESRYSAVAPSTDGEVIYRVLPPNLPIDNPYSEQVQGLLKITNLRINFTKLHTLGDDLLDRREEIQEKYYYAITEMVVRGSCSCYGHANRCLPLPGIEPKPDMVHGRCECTHNTKGRNCEKCEDFFNDLPWRPAIGKQTNACKRCNCNNHATSCHFDPALYESTGRVSGGFCDGCQHNTMGANCEQCKPFYYKDPQRDIQDPEVCRHPLNGLAAGSCHCKVNVEGRRCDVCKNGYWNFTDANPEGCQPCTCNILGTIDNQGCNVYTGECTCKRYVTDRNCDQCMQQYWGLSDSKDGCQPCNCDPGGSYDNFCDVITGQCKCRDHMTGRACDQPKQQYFVASLNYLHYEAETAKTSGQVLIREPSRGDIEDTWTGLGFVKVEGGFLEFIIDDIKTSMDYDIVIKYEPTRADTWEDVVVTVERPGPVDYNGTCARINPQDDVKHVSLPSNQRSVTVYPPTCLEAGKVYKIRLDFRTDRRKESPTASVLIDSIALIPRIEQIPWFMGSPAAEVRRREYEKFHCNDPSYFGKPKMYQRSVRNITSALLPCDCNSIGALDNFCQCYTGQCKCKPNTYGRECNKCRTGFWNFPNCERCDCNGHADTCEPTTGVCSQCRDNTMGDHCEFCINGFYGDPRINVDIPCRPCPCPGQLQSNHSFADTCSLDPITRDVICECKAGYAGARWTFARIITTAIQKCLVDLADLANVMRKSICLYQELQSTNWKMPQMSI
nr:unnamed protein product [Callosobruchus analis]